MKKTQQSDIKNMPLFTILLVFVCIVSIISCSRKSRNTYLPEFLYADSLCDSNPDSACAVVSQASANRIMSESDKMYAALLRIKAENNLYKPQKDSMIFHVVDFFKTTDDKDKLCQAYYYLGKYYLQHHDAPQALDKFQIALELTDEKTPLTFMSKTFSQCGGLFYEQDMYDDALEMYKKSYNIDVELKDTPNIVNGLRDMSQVYKNLDKTDSCDIMLRKAYSLALLTTDSSLKRSVAFAFVGLCLERGKVKTAHKIFSDNFIDIEDGMKSPVYVMAAEIFKKESDQDSCLYYCQKLLSVGTIYAREYAARELLDHYSQVGDMEKVRHYLALYKEMSDTVRTVTATQSVAKMRYLYDYTLREKENQSLRQASKEKTYIFIIILSVSFLIILYVISMNERKQKKCTEYNLLNNHLITLYENASKAYRCEKAQMKGRISELESKLDILSSRVNAPDYDVEAKRIAIYDMINEKVSGKKTLTPKDWTSIEQIIDNMYPHYKSRLYSFCNLSARDYHVCMLIKLGFANSDIATIMSRSASAISLLRLNMYERFFGKRGSAKDFDRFIKNM